MEDYRNTLSRSAMILRCIMACLVLPYMAATLSADNGTPKTSFRFAVIGDRTADAQEGVYEGILDEVERLRPDFAITVGDAIEGYTEDTVQMNSEWREYLLLIERLSMPLYYTPGNHDITTEAMRPSYERYIGPAYHSFDYGDCHFVVLDNTPGGGGPAEPFGEMQWAWLVNDLTDHADAAHTFLFCHKPFWYENRFENKPDSLHDLLVKHGVDAVFTGHYHSYFTAELDGIRYTGLGSSGGGARSPFEYLQHHFLWVTVDDDGIHIAPIDQNSVQPWDYTTAEQKQLVNKVQNVGVQMVGSSPEYTILMPDSGGIGVVIRNFSDVVLNDTIKWEIPAGWSVTPANLPIHLEPDSFQYFRFGAYCSDRLFPPPTLSLNYPLNSEVKIAVEKSMWVSRDQFCITADSEPVIDGELQEPIWTNPATELFGYDGSPAIIDSTWFYFAYDRNNLYLGAKCYESMMDSLRATVTERDGAIYGEDCVGYFFSQSASPGEVSDTVFQLYINPLGTIFDQKIVWDSTGWYETDRDWNGAYEIATHKDADFWYMEASIPLAELGVRSIQAGPLYLNFRRKQKRLGSSGDWQVPIDYDPRTYGVMRFEGEIGRLMRHIKKTSD